MGTLTLKEVELVYGLEKRHGKTLHSQEARKFTNGRCPRVSVVLVEPIKLLAQYGFRCPQIMLMCSTRRRK